MNSFRSRLLLAVIVVIVLVQSVTIMAVLARTHAEMKSAAEAGLQASVNSFHRIGAIRAEALTNHLASFVQEDAFTAAANPLDHNALRRMIQSYGARMRAELGFLIDSDDELLVSTSERLTAESARELATIGHTLGRKAAHNFLAVVDGRAFRIALAPVRLGNSTGWAGAGYEINDAALDQLGDIVDLDVSFVARDLDGKRHLSSTLPRDSRPTLYSAASMAADENQSPARVLNIGQIEYLTVVVPMHARRGDVYALMHQSMTDTMARFDRLRLEMLGISGAALLVAALIVALFSRRAMRPIDQLVSAAHRIEQGRYNERVVISGGKEFERLAAVFEGMQRRIAERESRIVHQARHDQLTGLPNRLAARSRLMRLLKAGAPVGLVLLDLRGFKHLNASFGHELANQILREIARRLTSAVRSGDSVARLGADQYLLLLRGSNADHAEATASQVVRDVRQGMLLGSIEVNLDVHAGVCAAPEHGTETEDLLRRADIALQEAKTRGVAICRYEAGHDETYRKRLKLLAELRAAITTNQLNLVYQPKVQMADRRVRSLEALVRWTHPQLGPIPPSEFVPLAEQTGAIGDLTRWVLRTAIEQLAAWRTAGFESELAVNLSASDLNDLELPDAISVLLTQNDVLPRQLVLEITESAIMREPEKAIRVMRQLREAGIRFAIDDFGTGHSSLAQLKSLPVDELKIDRSFIRDLEQGTRDDAIVRSAIELGHSLGLKVVAEGIETPAAWTALIRLGCDYAQGYFVSRPLAPDQVGDWIQELNARLANAESGTAQVRVLTELRTTRR